MENANTILPIEELQRRFAAVVATLPVIAGNEVVNFALDNFKRQGFLGGSFQPWKPRKKVTAWGKTKRNGRNILIDTGRLRRSVRVIRSNANEVVVGSDVPYAKAHNDGVRLGIIQNVKSYQRKVTTLGIVQAKPLKTKTKISFGRVDKGRRITVAAHKRRINQNIPARPFLKESPYLTAKLQRVIASQILKTLQ